MLKKYFFPVLVLFVVLTFVYVGTRDKYYPNNTIAFASEDSLATHISIAENDSLLLELYNSNIREENGDVKILFSKKFQTKGGLGFDQAMRTAAKQGYPYIHLLSGVAVQRKSLIPRDEGETLLDEEVGRYTLRLTELNDPEDKAYYFFRAFEKKMNSNVLVKHYGIFFTNRAKAEQLYASFRKKL